MAHTNDKGTSEGQNVKQNETNPNNHGSSGQNAIECGSIAQDSTQEINQNVVDSAQQDESSEEVLATYL